jgi:hypothetical protein
MKPEEQLVKSQNSCGIKVQSVVLPKNYNPYIFKIEPQVLDWLINKIYSQHSAYYKFSNKYSENNEQLSWNKNKMQNQRFLETTNR